MPIATSKVGRPCTSLPRKPGLSSNFSKSQIRVSSDLPITDCSKEPSFSMPSHISSAASGTCPPRSDRIASGARPVGRECAPRNASLVSNALAHMLLGAVPRFASVVFRRADPSTPPSAS
eukprot:8591066-Alexandrium_andersonii.AAC.1